MQSCQSQENIWKRSSHIKAFPDVPPLLNQRKLGERILQAAQQHQEQQVQLVISFAWEGAGKGSLEHLPVSGMDPQEAGAWLLIPGILPRRPGHRSIIYLLPAGSWQQCWGH